MGKNYMENEFLRGLKIVLEIFNKINIENPNIDNSINQKTLKDFNKRLRLQKLNYLLKEKGCINIFDYFNDFQDDYSWYMRGVHSTAFASIYYNASLNKEFLENKILNNQENIPYREINKFLENIINYFEINNEEEFNDVIEMISSIIFLKRTRGLTNEKDIQEFLKIVKSDILKNVNLQDAINYVNDNILTENETKINLSFL